MIDVHRLRLLRELSSRGTIAATARACSLTPSAVSQQLSILQREVGTDLLLKDGRTLILTDAAKVLVTHANRIFAELEAAQAGVAALAGRVGGVIKLGAFPTAASSLVPTAIAACRAAAPGLIVRLEEWETPDGLAALKSGHLDALLVYEFNLLPAITDPGVELTPLVTESLLAAVSPALALPGGTVPMRMLADHPWIAPSSDTSLRTVLERACGLAGFTPQLDYTSDDYTVILALVKAGLGVSVVPQSATEGVSTDVRLQRIDSPELTRRVSVAVRAGSAAMPNIAALVTELRNVAAHLDSELGSEQLHRPLASLPTVQSG